MNELYKRIKQRREELGLSQDELAKKLGYKSRSTIAKIEAGVNDIPQSKIEEFAEALYTTPKFLMGLSDFSDELDQMMHDIGVIDAKVYFHFLLRKLIEKFGYELEENFATDKEGYTTILFEGKSEKFEIREDLYDEFLNNCFSYIDYGFNKLIDKNNRVQSDYFIKCFCTERTTKEPFEIMRDFFKNQGNEKK
ncbi:hypothetical protein GCM10023142_10930 [Anaerocolumna aminovalerica]|uniref:Helix-turn-helix n=1 Tax=Anaerocolumna aminovalerica TaxID=1527 RepID=A0A1I5IYS8_9FIRM|nr:helix-turn-helix transcriptional regulator [Anaerocolumna aminovalerica]SFO65543.1 Helix-turn-helix [Anaerocolumna aminovalerica]